ncbi:MAG TPA: hypothetical protein VIK28_04190, partial [Sedimentisphaerales bacterium]
QYHAADEGVAGGDQSDETAPEENFVVTVVHGNLSCQMLAAGGKVSTVKNRVVIHRIVPAG